MLLLSLIIMAVSYAIQWRLKSKFEEYSKTPLQNGLSGEEAARMMLRDHGITDVKIFSVEGQLTDHYNPSDKTVNLSRDVFYGRNAAAVAVATHEVGHAVQHAKAYSWLEFRSQMVPALSVTSRVMPFIILAGVLMINFSIVPLAIGVALFALTTLFSFITLPVEFDASRRALVWMSDRGVVTSREHAQAKDALWWAAMTYVVAAIGSLATLLYYVMILGRSRD